MGDANLRRFYKRRRVLVAGGAGFIGAAVTARLVRLGAEVTVLARPASDLWRLASIKKQFRVARADFSSARRIPALIKKARPDIVMNLAARVDKAGDVQSLQESLAANFESARWLLEGASVAGVARFVQVGTIAEYGAVRAPFSERMQGRPVTAYALAKTVASHLALWFGRVTAMQVSVVRPAATYGPGQNFGMLVPNLIRAALRGKDFSMNPGAQLRDFVYVDDVATGIVAVAASPRAAGRIINLGSRYPCRVRDLAAVINRTLGNPIAIRFGAEPYRPGDPMRFYMDSRLARKLLGWGARTPLERGVAKTVRWYRAHRSLFARL